MDDVQSTEALQDEMQQLAERYACVVRSCACPLMCQPLLLGLLASSVLLDLKQSSSLLGSY